MYAFVITFLVQSSSTKRPEILALKSCDEVSDEMRDEHLYFAFLAY